MVVGVWCGVSRLIRRSFRNKKTVVKKESKSKL